MKFESSLIHNWLINDFYSELKNKDKDRLISVRLLSSEELEKYFPKVKSRVVINNNMASEWWLCDAKNEFIKLVKSDGSVGKKQPTEKCGIRPVIAIKLS